MRMTVTSHACSRLALLSDGRRRRLLAASVSIGSTILMSTFCDDVRMFSSSPWLATRLVDMHESRCMSMAAA
jgi:hypothetical protein